MGLQGELVDVLQSNVMELIDEICLDDVLLHLGSLFPPVRLLEWQVAVVHEPPKGDSSIDHGFVAIGLFSQPSYLAF